MHSATFLPPSGLLVSFTVKMAEEAPFLLARYSVRPPPPSSFSTLPRF